MNQTVGVKYLLDTVIIAGYFNNDSAILQHIAQATVYIPSVAIGELYFGAYKSQRISQNTQNIRTLIQIVTVLLLTDSTGDWYGQIKRALQVKGRPIPENDIWIAALTMQHGLILATRDAHFQHVDHLSFEIW